MGSEVIGRHGELASSEQFLDSLKDGSAALIIEGEAGIGKTILWEALRDSAARRGCVVLSSRPAESEARLSFAGLADLMGEVIDGIVPTLPQPQRGAIDVALLRADPDGNAVDFRALGTALKTCLERLATHQPVVVAVDDLQWLDRPTERVLDFAIRRVRGQAVGLVMTRRLDESEEASGRSVLGGLPESRIETMRLGPMSLAALHHLIRQRFGEVLNRPALTRLEQASAGNPLLALEIVGSLRRAGRSVTFDEMLPATADIRRLVTARIAGLRRPTRDVLQLAAALTRPDVEALAAAVPGRDVGASLRQAADAGLIVLDAGRIRFSHPLVRSAVYASASYERRAEMHGRLAETTSNQEEAARHLALATDVPDEAVAAKLESAATEAATRGAPDAAASLLEHARRLTRADRRQDRGRRGLALGQCLWEIGEVAGSRAVIEETVDDLPPGRTRSVGRLLLAVQALWTEGADAGIALCRAALRDAVGEPVLQATIHLRIAYAADDRLALAIRHARAALDLLEAPGVGAPDDLKACALLLDAERRLLATGGIDQRSVARARRLLPAPPDPAGGALAFNARAIARERDWLLRVHTDDLVGARDALSAMHRHDQQSGRDRAAPIQLSDLAELECWLGNLSIAREHAAAAGELAAQTGQTPYGLASARFAEAVVAGYEGDLRRGEQAAIEGSELAERMGGGPLLDRFRALRGFVALSAGRPADAVGHFAAVRDALRAAGVRHPVVYRFRGDEIEALSLTGEMTAARNRLTALETDGRRTQTPWIGAVSARCRGLLAAADGDLEGAVGHLEEALAHHAGLPMPLELGRTLLLKGQLHRRAKAKRTAADLLGQALEVFDRMGAAAWAVRARRELARIGLRPRAPDDLTATEKEVARLTASGMTNRQVADALVLSPRSVDGVLTRVYAKLGIRSRAELGAHMVDRGPAGVAPGGQLPSR
jgi:DNA-binding CsgD family transcriptional regulator